MVTAEYDQDEAVLKGYDAGAVDYLVKPYRPAMLRAKAAIFLELDRQKRELRRHRNQLEALVEERTRELRQSMEDLQRSNRDLEDFAYIASHDLQEPLRNVSSYVQLLARRYENALDEDARDFIRFAVEGTERMQSLINDLLSLSRVGTRGHPFDTVDTCEVLSQVLEDMQPALDESGAQVACGELPAVRADASQLRQLFQNLLGNAIKFRGEDPPRIQISAFPAADSKTPASSGGPASGREGAETGWWSFCIKDNGIGIDPRHADRIFQPFQRLHGRGMYPGTGIGLALCRRIVERHGGEIHVESEEGRGAAFLWTLQAA
jgi:light-regulated signal transduction histidine kinase (bacteriophytochrome)